MANEKTPLRDTAAPTPERAQKTADRSTVARRRVVIGLVIAVAAAGLIWFLFGRGEESVIPSVFSSSSPVADFTFKTVDAKPEATAAHIDKGKLEKAAKHNAPNVEATLTQLLQAGYVDPDSWGDAGALDDFFTDDAAKQVDPNIDTLSLGADAADTIESVAPMPSKLKVTSLIDGNVSAIRAYGEVTFKAKATNTDGTRTKIALTGTFFLVPDGDTWKVEAFDLDREMKPQKTKASAAAPTASATS